MNKTMLFYYIKIIIKLLCHTILYKSAFTDYPKVIRSDYLELVTVVN